MPNPAFFIVEKSCIKYGQSAQFTENSVDDIMITQAIRTKIHFKIDHTSCRFTEKSPARDVMKAREKQYQVCLLSKAGCTRTFLSLDQLYFQVD